VIRTEARGAYLERSENLIMTKKLPPAKLPAAYQKTGSVTQQPSVPMAQPATTPGSVTPKPSRPGDGLGNVDVAPRPKSPKSPNVKVTTGGGPPSGGTIGHLGT